MDEDDYHGGTGHYVLLALTMLLILGTLVVSARPITLGNVPDVLPVRDVPAGAHSDQLRRYADFGAYTIPRTRIRPQIMAAIDRSGADAEPHTKLGYSVRQISFLGLPLFAYREIGYVLYLDTPTHLRIVPLGEDGLALLTKQIGEDLTNGWIYPFWLTCWGWIGAGFVAGFFLLEHRRQVRRRAALGLI